ncbi:MAG: sulfurtransferase TusA family protein [Candidatus Micrarchaeaceae archaeon]
MGNRIFVDARGSSCPGPIVELSKAYRNASVGDTIELWATDPGVKADVAAWAEKTKNKVESITEQQDKIVVIITISNR